MLRKVVAFLIVVCVSLLMDACSNHPPSAAMFMNSKKNVNFGVGAAARFGELSNSTFVYDNSDDAEISSEEGYWNTELSFYYGTPYIVLGLNYEDYTTRLVLGAKSDYLGLISWVGFAGKKAALGVMLVEQNPVSENFKFGLSEHFSMNSYRVIDDPGCCSMNDVYADSYKELGVGTYVSYKRVSAEFRLGHDIDSSNNRFYFMLNYLFAFGK